MQFILGDEVGLGKTIEACLVIAQKWAERKRNILLVLPASLRKQWAQELKEKFSLDSLILDAKTFKAREKEGKRPFKAKNTVVIVSYEFAAGRVDDLAIIDWDLVVYDEAHRLRNVYKKNGSKRAKVLKDALHAPFKMLLTATPLQNSLMELFGLISIIDDRHFGDKNSFRTMYTGAKTSSESLEILKSRIAPVCQRTLRRQVIEAGHIKFTRRLPCTFDFEPSDEEVQLYNDVSGFLQRKDTIAFGDRANHLVTMVARKTLGSSTFAISKFLQNIIDRLEKRKRIDEEALSDIDTVSDLAEELGGIEETQEYNTVDPLLLEAEITELKGYLDLASSIHSNAKGDKLVDKLPDILQEITISGGQEKAVIFTESIRTQEYLNQLLKKNGFDGRIVLLNGTNDDKDSKSLYADWLIRHNGTDMVSGSKSADMKATIVEAFKSPEKAILISTESGAEGINLQFCSLVINFDLPWNPQRVEQRIGRCHRYGQKLDVTVVNLLNRQNMAEARVYELLDKKFKLFEGVFGASDEILGTIERGIDFEKKVVEIAQEARSDEEVRQHFDALQEEMEEAINKDMQDARKKLLENMDQDVVEKLKTHKDKIEHSLGVFTKSLLTVAKVELPDDTVFHGDQKQRFDFEGETFTTEWPIADEEDWQFFRLSDGNLAETLVNQAKTRQLSVHCLQFNHSLYPKQLADVQGLIGQSGWLKLSKFIIKSPQSVREYIIVACVTDEGEKIHAETVDRLFLVPATDIGVPVQSVPNDKLLAIEEIEQKKFHEQAQLQNEEWLDAETEKFDSYADDLEEAAEIEIKEIDTKIKSDKKALRGNRSISMTDKLNEKRRIKRMEKKRDAMKMETFERRNKIHEDVDKILDEIAQGMDIAPVLEPLFTIRWEVVA